MPLDPTNPTYQEMEHPPKVYTINELITGYGGTATLADVKTGLAADLPYECPKCRDSDGHGTGLITVVFPDTTTAEVDCDICFGIGKLAEEKSAVCTQYSYE